MNVITVMRNMGLKFYVRFKWSNMLTSLLTSTTPDIVKVLHTKLKYSFIMNNIFIKRVN